MIKTQQLESKLEQQFSKYQIALLGWNEAIGNLHKAQKLTDSIKNRINNSVKHEELSIAYKKYKTLQNNLNMTILKDHNKKPNWNNAAKEIEN